MVSSIDVFDRDDHKPQMQNLRKRMCLLEGGLFNRYDFICYQNFVIIGIQHDSFFTKIAFS